MKKIYVNKHFYNESNWYPNYKFKDLATNYMIPFFNKFNNISYIKDITSTNTPWGEPWHEYVFQIKDYENRYMTFDANGNTSYLYWGFYLFSNWIYSLSADYGVYPVSFTRRNYADSIATSLDYTKWGFEFYYITDEDNNLKVFWEINCFNSYLQCYPTVFVTTASGRDGVAIFNDSGTGAVSFFYLDDPYNVRYYIPWNFGAYVSKDSVIKLNYIPIQIGNNATYMANSQVVDVIDSELVYILNTDLKAVAISGQNNNTLPFIRKLIRVDGKNYRQLIGNWWYEDPKGDEPVTKLLDENYSF